MLNSVLLAPSPFAESHTASIPSVHLPAPKPCWCCQPKCASAAHCMPSPVRHFGLHVWSAAQNSVASQSLSPQHSTQAPSHQWLGAAKGAHVVHGFRSQAEMVTFASGRQCNATKCLLASGSHSSFHDSSTPLQ